MLILLIVATIIGFNQLVECFTCTDDCLSKTYCLSADGSTDCSGRIKVRVKFSVIQRPGSFDRLHINLSGYDIKLLDEMTIGLILESLDEPAKGQTVYTCYRSLLGSTKSSVFQKDSNSSLTFGSSYYSNKILSCNWIFSKYDTIWPMVDNKPVKLIDTDQWSIKLNYGSIVSSIVANDLSQLPIYKMQFLNCCNKVHTSGKYLFTFSQSTNSVNYLVQVFDPSPLATTIVLTNLYGDRLIFSCLFATIAFNAKFADDQGEKVKINDQISAHYIADGRCSWSTLANLNCTTLTIDLINDVYNLQIIAGSVVIYTENGVTLKNACSLTTKHLDIILLLVMIIGHSLRSLRSLF